MRAPAAADGPVGALFRCDGCGGPQLLLARVRKERLLCANCHRLVGSPPAWTEATDEEILAAENRVRDKMQRRGGPERHLVRSGGT